MSVDLLNQYIDCALTFERLAKAEPNSGLKVDLERQADAYRRLAEKCASRLGLPPPSKPRPMPITIANKPSDGAFDPETTASMAAAFEDVCRALKVENKQEREVLAIRIVDLARDGEGNRDRLRERVLLEASRAEDLL